MEVIKIRLLNRGTVYKRIEERSRSYNGELEKVLEDGRNIELSSQYIFWHLLSAYCDKNRDEMLKYIGMADKYIDINWCENNYIYLFDLIQDSKYITGLADKPSEFYFMANKDSIAQ